MPNRPSKLSLRYIILLFLALGVVIFYVTFTIKTLETELQVDQQISCSDLSDIIGPSDNLMFGPTPKISWMCQPGKICFYDVDNDNQCCETIDQCKKIVDEWGVKD